MSKTAFTDFFVLRTHVVPNIYGYYRCLVVFMYQKCQTIGEQKAFMRNINFVCLKSKSWACSCNAKETSRKNGSSDCFMTDEYFMMNFLC